MNDRVAYEFRNKIDVRDLGLRLTDVQEYDLEDLSEACEFSGGFAADTITTAEEREFLKGGERVELNAMTSPQLVEWLETKLQEQLPNRLVPNDRVLKNAYRRALAAAEINRALEEIIPVAKEHALEAEVPENLRQRLKRVMKKHPAMPWDEVLYRVAKRRAKRDEQGDGQD
jgi:hypothetical protein